MIANIPPALIGLVGPMLSEAYTHSGLNSLFMASGFPGDAPDGNKTDKCLDWMRRANRESSDPLPAFGQLIAEFMDCEVNEDLRDQREADRQKVRDALAKDSLSYSRGGFIIGGTLAAPSKALAERLRVQTQSEA